MPQQFSNNARSALAAGISDTATSLTVAISAADLFPVADVGTGSLPSNDDWFKATIQDTSGNFEIVYVRTRASGSAIFGNVVRAQEGTTARTFAAGSVVGLRATAADFLSYVNILGNDNVFTGANEFIQPITVDLVGNVTGTADAAVKVTAADYTLEQSGSDLVIKYGATVVAKIDSTGNFVSAAKVTGFGSL